MKTKYFLAMVLLVGSTHIYAQFTDDMEDYADGDPICINWWTDWEGDCSSPLIASSERRLSGDLSGKISGDGTTHAVLNLGNKLFGNWCFEFWMYVPSNKEATLSMQGTVPIEGGQSVVGDIRFNPDLATPGQGYIEDTALGQITFPFPHDQWFRVYMGFDITAGISLATWGVQIDGGIYVPFLTPFKNEAGDIPTSLGGLALRSTSTDHLFYVEDIYYSTPIHGNCSLSIEDFKTSLFTLSPNPVRETLFIQSERVSWETATIYSLSGQVALHAKASDGPAIDVRALASGLYFVEITSQYGSEVIRLVRE